MIVPFYFRLLQLLLRHVRHSLLLLSKLQPKHSLIYHYLVLPLILHSILDGLPLAEHLQAKKLLHFARELEQIPTLLM